MTPTTEATPRTIRVNHELWESFTALVTALDPNSSASAKIREMMKSFVDDHAVFMAAEHESIDPTTPLIPWYDCEEHDQPHRLLGGQPWGCSVAKARADRLAKA